MIRNEQLCIGCNRCNRGCPVNIPVASKKQVTDIRCMTCLQCVDVCPVLGALDLRIHVPPAFKKEKQALEQ
ncbi:MAG TPA: 4Fe-4S dicluster domain-containing protein [Clostridia bacterium]|nr:4Fe-4S dicluster domain-containing protein [Clostridia bacterium]